MNNDAIIKAAVERMKEAVEADRENREEALDDLEKLAGRQWPETIKTAREGANRPCLTINRLPQFVRQVTGDIRNMNPAVNIIPGDTDASPEVAEIIEGLVRQIQYRSNASAVFEAAAENAAQCGMGFFRIRADYEDDQSFNQEILIERIHNPFSVYCDPAAKMPTREDQDWCFVSEKMALAKFRREYPGKVPADVDVDGQTDGLEHWRQGDEVIVAEYFWKEPVEKTLSLLEDGTVALDVKAPLRIVRQRKVNAHKVMWAKVSGADVLEGPTEMACNKIPVIAVTGEEMYVGDEVLRTSVIRFAKDPQQLYNYWRSAQTELVALQPKAPFLVTPKQVAGLETLWAQANDTNAPYLPFNPDEKAPGAPQRATPPIPSQGMMQEVLTAAEDMKATTGVYDAALGNRSNENSGVAIRQRQMESDVSTSIYADNMAKAIQVAGEIIVQMIPKIYDTQRVVTILGKDDAEQLVRVNGVAVGLDGVVPVNDLTIGKYDVRVTVGPNYSTMRQETAESMISFVKAFPAAAQVTGDLVAKHMDWPGADEFADRLKKLLPPGIAEDGDMDPEKQAMAAQIQELSQALQQIQQQPEYRKAVAEASEAESDAEKARFETMEQQLETMAKTGQLNAAIGQIVQVEVARALQGAMQPGYGPF